MSNAVGVIIAGSNTYLDNCIEESAEHTNDITEYPIEDGSKIHSHAHLLPRSVTAEGLIVGPGYQGRLNRLKGLRESRSIVSYSGRMFYSSLVIKDLTESYDSEILNGVRVRVEFQEVKVVGGGGGGGSVVPISDPAGAWWQI